MEGVDTPNIAFLIVVLVDVLLVGENQGIRLFLFEFELGADVAELFLDHQCLLVVPFPFEVQVLMHIVDLNVVAFFLGF